MKMFLHQRYFGPRFNFSYAIALLLSTQLMQAQPIYSDYELLSNGTNYYNRSDYRNAEVFLFAYVQRNPAFYQTNSQLRREITAAIQDAHSKATTAGADSKMDGITGSIKITPPPPVQVPGKTNIHLDNIPKYNQEISNGKYTCDDGGTYFITVTGNEVWWFGIAKDSSWSNVMNGYISGNILSGRWSDVPLGKTRSSGIIKLRIDSNRKLVAIEKTGGFGGSNWQLYIGTIIGKNKLNKF